MNADDSSDKMRFERLKLEIDVVKHVSTLSTGSLVLIVTLADKLPKPLLYPQLVQASLCCFVASLLCCLLYLVSPWSVDTSERSFVTITNFLAFLAAGLSLVLGIGLLGVFGIVNLGKP